MAKTAMCKQAIQAGTRQAADDLCAGDYFSAELAGLSAVTTAVHRGFFCLALDAIDQLWAARGAKRDAALAAGGVFVASDPEAFADLLEPGCLLVAPPLVGAHARRYRERADEAGVPVVVVAHEPRTVHGDWPLVGVGPVVLRTKVGEIDAGRADWILDAVERLGACAAAHLEGDSPAGDRAAEALEYLAAVPESRVLHSALRSLCEAAALASADRAA